MTAPGVGPTQQVRIVLKSGVVANLTAAATTNNASAAEPFWTTDGKTLYVFDGTNMIPIGGNAQPVFHPFLFIGD